MSYPITLSGGWSKLAEEVDAELARARKKFPEPVMLVTALSEEYGEAIKEILDAWPKGGPNAEEAKRIRKEIVQTMAMCVRVLLDGDPAHRLKGQVE